MSPNETIAAIASAAGPAARGIIRLSGRNIREVLSMTVNGNTDHWHPRQSRRYDIEIAIADGELMLPCALHLWPTNRSFTGEPLAEIHLTGSPPLLNEVLELVLTHGARPAEPGEFTLRAFLSGRIDLVQAEAVLGVIDAGDTTELERALSQLAGGISGPIAELREQLLLHLADLEAGLDFVEEDIEFVHRDELARRLLVGKEMIERLLQQISSRMQSTGRPRVVLAGLPNAGKSTLFNTLAGRETALVSSFPGTTRDYLQVSIDRGGMTFDLIDTAGWEAARDGIEQLASALRDDQYRRAQLIIWCSAANLSPTEREEDQAYRDIVSSQKIPYLKVVTKSDRLAGLVDHLENDISLISAETGQGIDAFLDRIAETLSARPSESDMIGSTAARCRESLKHALSGIENAVDMTAQGAGDELIAMELRDILEHLGRIVGQVYTDDILDRIFSRFCIGK